MKTKMIVLLMMLVGLAVGAASTQSTEPVHFRAPFAFVVGDNALPAGDYTVRFVSSPGLLLFYSADGAFNAFANSVSLQKNDTEDRFRLVFHRYGSHYYVSEIWTPGYRTGRSVKQAPMELELAKSLPEQHVTLYADAGKF
jgi:hypothetical protein